MSNNKSVIQRIAITIHPKMSGVTEQAAQVCDFLQNLGVKVEIFNTDQTDLPEKLANGDFDLLIALGGDGTMLRAGHLTSPHGIPLLGINMGRFGFLMQLGRDEWQEYLPRLVNGGFQIENRMMLKSRALARR